MTAENKVQSDRLDIGFDRKRTFVGLISIQDYYARFLPLWYAV